MFRWFQSYQFRQINPDQVEVKEIEEEKEESFNRINSDRSIPTIYVVFTNSKRVAFQSYQFRQINPDR